MSSKVSKNNNQSKKPLNKNNKNKLSLPILQINSNTLDNYPKNTKNSVTIKTRVHSCEKEENKLSESINIKNGVRFSQGQPYQLPLITSREQTEASSPNNLDKIIDDYNKLKLKINEFNKTSENNLKNSKSIQDKNTILLKYVSKLNNILESILSSKINKKNIPNSKKYMNTKLSTAANHEVKENNNKLLKTYITQYNILYNKYQKYSNENFVNELREKIKNYSESISDLEKKNRQLQTLQQKSEYAFKKNNSPQGMDSDIKFKSDDIAVLTKELNQLIAKSSKNQEKINENENKLNKLIKNEQTLITIATDIYEIKNPEKKIEEKKIEQVDNDLCTKKQEIEKATQLKKISIKKTNEKLSSNKKIIKELELEKNYKRNELFEKTNKLYLLNDYLNDLEKKSQIDKNNAVKNKNKKNQNVPSKSVSKTNNIQSEILRLPKILSVSTNNENKIIYTNDNTPSNITENNNNKIENNSPYSEGKLIKSYTDKRNEYINFSNDKENKSEFTLNEKDSNKKQLNKEAILKNLEEQNVKENNLGQSRLINNPNSSINIKRTKLKPNFSFTLGGIVNQINNIKINKSVSLIPKNNSQEFGDEIKEDILTDNIDDDMVNIKNSKTLNKENNINSNNKLTKSSENVKRESALNTILYNQLDGEENNENKENKEELSSSDANNHEHVFTTGKSLKKINGQEVKVDKENEKESVITINNKKEDENVIEGVVIDVDAYKGGEKKIKDGNEDGEAKDEVIEEYE